MSRFLGRLRKTPSPAQAGAESGAASRGGWEVLIAVLLGVAAIATAWAAYQATLADGNSIERFNRSVALTDQASQSYNEGNQALMQDQAIFLEYVKAIQSGDEELAAYVQETLMSDDLAKAIAWWSNQGDEYPTPFVEENPDYEIGAFSEAARLDDQAAAAFAAGKAQDKEGDRYTLVTVILAAALFLLGVAGVTRSHLVSVGFMILGGAFLIGSVIQLARIRWG